MRKGGGGIIRSSSGGAFLFLLRRTTLETLFQSPDVLVPDAEVAADGERLLLDLGLEFDFGRTLLLALDLLELGGAARDALQTAQFFFNLP